MKLNPDAQFVPNSENLNVILSHYSLILDNFEFAKSGIENCTVFVETNKGKYVLRIYRHNKKTVEDMILEANFVNYLYEHGIPVAAPLKNQAGIPVTKLSENDKVWCAILMPTMNGAHAEEYSDELISSLAALQAEMHLLAKDFDQPYSNVLKLHELREGHFIRLIKDRDNHDTVRAGFIDRAETYVVNIDDKLPSGLCHLDFDNGNVLTQDDTITAVLDFDDLEFSPFVRCLGYTVWDVAFDKGMQAMQKYISEYEKLRRLNDDERNILMPIVLFRHYVIGCKDIADNQMDDKLLSKYIELERELIASISVGN